MSLMNAGMRYKMAYKKKDMILFFTGVLLPNECYWA